MKNTFEFQLVKGKFSPAEAKEVLLTLITDKINFHKQLALSNHLRFDVNDER